MHKKIVLLALASVVSLTGCVIQSSAPKGEINNKSLSNTTYPYGEYMPNIGILNPIPTLALAVKDDRDYVVDQRSQPSFVGIIRPEYGEPVEATIASGEALSTVISNMLGVTFAKQNLYTVLVPTVPQDNSRVVVDTLLGRAQERAALITIHEWASDTFLHSAIKYDLEIQIFSPEGKTLAFNRINGLEQLGRDAADPIRIPRELSQRVLASRLEALFAQPEVIRALTRQ
ncbi:MAG: hypothetical protein K0R63_1247 [Rickettsiales bacterium]|jgi:hypothetical protein|nr:hypothetical protein [Rickettsiales bacterium]